MQVKAITPLSLAAANPGKLAALDEVSAAYMALAQGYVDHLVDTGQSEPDKDAELPSLPTALSERWKRTAWRQACGLAQSWFSNAHGGNRPVLRGVCIQANANVALLIKAEGGAFDYWLRVSTLDKGQPVWLPIKLYRHAQVILEQYEQLCASVTLNKRKGRWSATFVVERHNRKGKARGVVGVDLGMSAVATTSQAQQYGRFVAEVQHRLNKAQAKRVRKQKLNACLRHKGKPTLSLEDSRTEAFVRNGVGRALNQLIADLPAGCAVALERLKVADMRFKSRAGNRLLKAYQLGYLRDRLKFKLDEHAIRYRSVQPAYSSQQCSQCGFVLPLNRPDQAHFKCLWCGYQQHADLNAALNIAERFGDQALNALPFGLVETTLVLRFLARLSVAGRATAARDTLTKSVSHSEQLVNPPVNQFPMNSDAFG